MFSDEYLFLYQSPIHKLFLSPFSLVFIIFFSFKKQDRGTDDNQRSTSAMMTINVQDVNDNSPKFAKKLFTGGVTTQADFGSVFMKIKVSLSFFLPHSHSIIPILNTLTQSSQSWTARYLIVSPFSFEFDTQIFTPCHLSVRKTLPYCLFPLTHSSQGILFIFSVSVNLVDGWVNI